LAVRLGVLRYRATSCQATVRWKSDPSPWPITSWLALGLGREL